ncbi:hypothetical protein IIY66_02685 [Candidatus Saccharibacteria bacterium]|nr:hypothetical protein [Candidatus Saccharibacteria bacterium]
MQKSNDTQQAKKTHRQMQSSTTLNRRYVKRPVKTTATGAAMNTTIKRSPQIQRFAQPAAKMRQPQTQQQIAPAQQHPMQATANTKARARSSATASTPPRPTAKQLKDQAIQKALAAASSTSTNSAASEGAQTISKAKRHFGIGRVVLALSCAAAAVFAIVYFVNLNMPDISLKVAAIQTGIEATYPSYIPRDFTLAGIVSEDCKITLNFSNGATGDTYSLTEENSSWDSNALLTNYVKEQYGDNYTVVREQGLTIYISGSDASWTNGGIVYKLAASSGTLTKKQISTIATSL